MCLRQLINERKGSSDHRKLIEMLEDVNDYTIPIEDVIEKHFAYAEPDLEFMKITKENYNEIAAKIPVLGNIQRHNRWCRDECAGSYRRSCHDLTV